MNNLPCRGRHVFQEFDPKVKQSDYMTQHLLLAYTQEKWNVRSHKNVYMNVHDSKVYNSQKIETANNW